MSTSFATITAPVTGKPDVNPATNPQASGPVKPQPGAPKPTLVKPNGPPVPVLQQLGYHGGIADFNAALQGVVDAHTKTFGYQPKPDVALKMVVSPPPVTPSTDAAALNAHKQANPDDYLVTRPDGVMQPNNAFYRMIVATTPKPESQLPQTAFLKKYPMVTMGILPIPSFPKLERTLKYLDSPVSQPTPSAPRNNTPYRMPGDVTTEEQAALDRQTQLRRNALMVTTVKQAQQELNTAMGTQLPVTGIFNDTWTKSLQNWMKTTSYAQQVLTYQAQDAGFGKNVDGYVRAYKQKQRAMGHGLTGWFTAAMPLPLFGHGSLWDDLFSIPGYLKGTSNNPLNIGLHSLTKSAGLTLDTVGGTLNQWKADLAAGTTLANEIAVTRHGAVTYEQALKDARKQIHASPTWMRALSLGYLPEKETGWLKALDQATNVAGDLILLRKPAFTGEAVGAGDVAVAVRSPYLSAASRWAYNDLAAYGQDGIGRAASRLEGGQGARALVARAAKLVQRGEMTPEQFQQHVAELYANGRTTVQIGDKQATVTGPLLNSLRTAKLPTPGIPGRAWLTTKSHLRDWLDTYDTSARANGATLAPNFAASLRSAVSHYVPARLGYFDEILPERVFNFVLKHQLGDDTAALANRLESQLVRFQGTENVRGIQQVERKLHELYFKKNPVGNAVPDDPFNAVLSTEAPSVFKFAGGGEQEVNDALKAVEANTAKVNRTLNRIAVLHSRIILSGVNPFTGLGGFSLFWKHAIGDTLRAEAGGGGILTGADAGVAAAKREIEAFAAADPGASRTLGAFRERMVDGEANWLLNRGGAVLTRSFRTGEHFAKSNYMAGAGGYLRRMLDDPALQAYQAGGNSLTQLILHDRTYRGMWKSAAAKAKPDTLTAEDYAASLEERYKQVQDALTARNLTYQDAKGFYDTVRGAKADKQLGKWIEHNQLDFDVNQAQVEMLGSFDKLTGDWLGNVVMRPNKWNRGRFAENVMASTYSDLRKAGFTQQEALNTATSVAGKLTKYHMLDFANRLQVEQDLRWLSYFATKHRLYWKWVIGTFARHPGYAAAVSDFSNTLDSHGGWTLPFRLLGTRWDIPLERLVWVPGREYDETSPLALGVFNFVKSGGNLDAVVQGAVGTNGNVITRSDTATQLGSKLLKIEFGAPATYQYATSGLDKRTASYITRALNEYQITYERAHGHYDTEQSAVKKVLLAQTGFEFWRANLPLPVVPVQDRTEQQKLMAQFMALADPRARTKFLRDHQGFSDSFGVYDNPNVNLRNRQFFERWTKALDAFRSARQSLYDQATATGTWTTAMETDRRDLTKALQRTRNQLLIDDAHQAGIHTRGQTPDGVTVPYGPWGKLVDKDPMFDLSHALNTLFPKLTVAGSSTAGLPGPLQKQMQQDIDRLSNPAYIKAAGLTAEQAKTYRGALIDKLSVYKSYPSDALGSVQETYQTKYVNAYWTGYNQRYNAAKELPSSQRSAADAKFRAWRDAQDHPVKVNGITFPSPARMAWAMLDPVTRQQRLSYLASKPLSDLADYELDLLEVKHPPHVSAAVAAITAAVTEARNNGVKVGRATIDDAAKQVDATPGYHGFYSYYTATLATPRIVQFTKTAIYDGMPATVREAFDQIATPARDVAKNIIADPTTAGAYAREWRQQVRETIAPWVALPGNKALRDYLAPMGPDFLYTLVSVPSVG